VALRIITGRFWSLSLVAIAFACALSCGGGSKTPALNPTSPATLSVNANAIDFGSVAVGSSKNQKGSLAAGGASVTISTASWNGQGYSLSGITFPATVASGKSISFDVTFAPQAWGTASGKISFLSDASNSPSVVTMTGSGTQSHSVSLSWNASTSPVAGYNVYRSQPGGQYAKLSPSLVTGLAFTDTSVQSGATYYYAATSVDPNNVESTFSNVATAVIP
jgi:hypothetical protein